MSEMVCVCLCHLGIRPTKGEIKAHLRDGVDGIDPIAIATACSQCRGRHAECIDGMRLCACGHAKWKHMFGDGCSGTYEERCRCPEFSTAKVQR